GYSTLNLTRQKSCHVDMCREHDFIHRATKSRRCKKRPLRSQTSQATGATYPGPHTVAPRLQRDNERSRGASAFELAVREANIRQGIDGVLAPLEDPRLDCCDNLARTALILCNVRIGGRTAELG